MINKDNISSIGISLVIPLYNNEKTLLQQITACEHIIKSITHNYEILVSEDMSKDKSREELVKLKSTKLKVYYQKNNLGITKNIMFLYKTASKANILLYSVDGAWNPEDIKKLIQKKLSTNAGIVVGKRSVNEYSLLRRIVSLVYNALPILLFSVRTYDTGSIKIFSRNIFNNIRFQSTSISFESEMLIKASKKGYRIETVPVTFVRPKDKQKSGVNFSLMVSSCKDLISLRLKGLSL